MSTAGFGETFLTLKGIGILLNIGRFFFFSNLSHSTIITVQFIFPVSLQAPGVHINTLLDFQTLLYLLNKRVDKNQNHLTPKDYLKG